MSNHHLERIFSIMESIIDLLGKCEEQEVAQVFQEKKHRFQELKNNRKELKKELMKLKKSLFGMGSFTDYVLPKNHRLSKEYVEKEQFQLAENLSNAIDEWNSKHRVRSSDPDIKRNTKSDKR